MAVKPIDVQKQILMQLFVKAAIEKPASTTITKDKNLTSSTADLAWKVEGRIVHMNIHQAQSADAVAGGIWVEGMTGVSIQPRDPIRAEPALKSAVEAVVSRNKNRSVETPPIVSGNSQPRKSNFEILNRPGSKKQG